jgi:hypothetical protein
MKVAPRLALLALASAAAPRGVVGGFSSWWSSGGTKSESPEEAKKAGETHAQALTEWFRSKADAALSSSVEIRPRSLEDPRLGVFVTAPIEEGDVIMSVPHELFLSATPPQVGDKVEAFDAEGEEVSGEVTAISESDGSYTVKKEDGELVADIPISSIHHSDEIVNCGTVRRVIQEMKSGESSTFAPYIEFMGHAPSAGSIPASWSAEGRALLADVLGKGEDGAELLPPVAWSKVLSENWSQACRGNKDDPLESAAFAMSIRRAWGDVFVPVFDVIGHRNGDHVNAHHSAVTKSHDPDSSQAVVVEASRKLEPGQEVFITYNFCNQCQNRRFGYGTAELLRDYGFVERLPQRWVFDYNKTLGAMVFDLDEEEVEVEGGKKKKLSVLWSAQYRLPTDPGDATFFTEQAARLEALGKSLTKNDRKVPEHEFRTIVHYHHALLTALKVGIESIKEGVSKDEFFLMDTEEQLDWEEDMAAGMEEEDEEPFEEEEFFEDEDEDEEFFDEQEEEEL